MFSNRSILFYYISLYYLIFANTFGFPSIINIYNMYTYIIHIWYILLLLKHLYVLCSILYNWAACICFVGETLLLSYRHNCFWKHKNVSLQGSWLTRWRHILIARQMVIIYCMSKKSWDTSILINRGYSHGPYIRR